MPWHAAQSIPFSPNAGVARVLPIQVTGVRCPVLSDFPTAIANGNENNEMCIQCIHDANGIDKKEPRNTAQLFSSLSWKKHRNHCGPTMLRLWVPSSSGVSASAYRCRQRRPATWVQNAKSIAQTNVFCDGNTTTPPLAPLVLLVPALALALVSPLPLHNTSDRTIPGIWVHGTSNWDSDPALPPVDMNKRIFTSAKPAQRRLSLPGEQGYKSALRRFTAKLGKTNEESCRIKSNCWNFPFADSLLYISTNLWKVVRPGHGHRSTWPLPLSAPPKSCVQRAWNDHAPPGWASATGHGSCHRAARSFPVEARTQFHQSPLATPGNAWVWGLLECVLCKL